jgi:DNA-binding NarL/FixJ family response regulator
MSKSRILIAHRDAGTRSALRMRLESDHGIHVIAECGNGADAIHWIEMLRPTTAYLEAEMPDLNANEVLAWLLPDERPATVHLLDEQGEPRFTPAVSARACWVDVPVPTWGGEAADARGRRAPSRSTR